MSAARASALPDSRSTRDAILDAAERHFAERGFAGVSVREIAGEAGLRNQGSLYHHFRDKHALYDAVLTRGVEALLAEVTGMLARVPPVQADDTLDRVLDYLTEHPHLPRLIQRAGIEDDPRLRETARRILGPIYRVGLETIATWGGPWEAADFPHVAAGLYHVIFGYFASGPLFDTVLETDTHSPAAVTRQRRFVKDAVARLLGPLPAPRLVPSTPRAGRR